VKGNAHNSELFALFPSVMQLRHMADYQQPGVSQRQAEKAVREAQEFFATLRKKVLHGSET